MSDAFDHALATATPDVAATLRWLVDHGAELVNQRGGVEGSGDVLIELAFDDAVLTITKDRGQWMLDVQVGALPRVDFDVIHAALTGDDAWVRHVTRRALPEQLPEGVSWLEELPLALRWLRTTPDAEDRLVAIQRARAARLFGP